LKFHVRALPKILFRFAISNDERPDEISTAVKSNTRQIIAQKEKRNSSFNYNPEEHKLFIMENEDSN
jgi:hypothetical protein